MKLLEDNSKGKKYQAEEFKILYRNKETISGDNSENPKEIIYLVKGSAEITLKDKTWKISSPEKISLPENTYHKIRALTEIILIVID